MSKINTALRKLLLKGRLKPIIDIIEDKDKGTKRRFVTGYRRKLTSRKKGQSFMLQKPIEIDEKGNPVEQFKLEKKEEVNKEPAPFTTVEHPIKEEFNNVKNTE